MLSQAAWGKASLLCMDWAEKKVLHELKRLNMIVIDSESPNLERASKAAQWWFQVSYQFTVEKAIGPNPNWATEPHHLGTLDWVIYNFTILQTFTSLVWSCFWWGLDGLILKAEVVVNSYHCKFSYIYELFRISIELPSWDNWSRLWKTKFHPRNSMVRSNDDRLMSERLGFDSSNAKL